MKASEFQAKYGSKPTATRTSSPKSGKQLLSLTVEESLENRTIHMNKKIEEAIKRQQVKDLEKHLCTDVVAEYRFHHTRKWRFDYWLPKHGIAIEVEGGVWTKGRHTRGLGYKADMEKYSEAAIMGIRVLRFTPDELMSPKSLEMVKRAISTDVEIWRDIKGVEERYRISDKGNVFSKELGRFKKCTASKNGYITLRLKLAQREYKTFYLHRLVAEAFIGDIPKGMAVNHKDGVKSNNSLSNLEIVTYSENNKHSYRELNRPHPFLGKKGEMCMNSKPVIQMDLKGNTIAEYVSAREAFKQTGVRASDISGVCIGRRKSAKKFKWKFK